MSFAPIPFRGKEKELPFDVATVRKIITDLIVRTADDVESEVLEIKSWCRSERDLADHVSEAALVLRTRTAVSCLWALKTDRTSGASFPRAPILASPGLGLQQASTT